MRSSCVVALHDLLLAAAIELIAGMPDQDAFGRLVAPHRHALHAHCYRMLGSFEDAEDALQETLLRAWKARAAFERGRPPRPWLFRIATNVCLDALAQRPRRVLPIHRALPAGAGDGAGEPSVDVPWLEPYPDDALGPEASYEEREAVELAFIAALQHLPPRQRAVLILREVLGFSAREVAATLDTTSHAVNSALQRARGTLEGRLPARSQQATLRSLGDARVRRLVRDYIAAWERRDVDALVALLAEDVTLEMPPYPNWFRGRDAVIAFIVGTGRPALRHRPVRANGQPGVAWYVADVASSTYRPASIEVLAIAGERMGAITAFASPALFARFGLPDGAHSG
jgi:RNA polymerase sigma-70 factor (ECF subfamily)